MKLPRGLSGEELTQLLKQYGYQVSRQTGSHIRLTTTKQGEHHITIPKHKPLRIGTLGSILTEVATHLKVDKETVVKDLFGGKH